MDRSRNRDTNVTGARTAEAEGTGRLMGRERLIRASSAQHRGKRLEQDLEVQAQRPVLDIGEVKLQPLREREIAPAGDLPQAGQTRLDAETLALDALVEEIHVPNRHGTRTDEAHLTGQHVEDLGELVEAAAAQGTSDARDPRIVGDLEDGARGLVQVLDLRLSSIGILHHRAELQHSKAALAAADPLLDEEDRTGRIQLDSQHDEADYGEQQRDHEGRDGEV